MHVVYLGAHAGLYYSIEHLKIWPHYGVLCGEDLDNLFHRASAHFIQIKIYLPDRDYLTEKSIVVINNILHHATSPNIMRDWAWRKLLAKYVILS